MDDIAGLDFHRFASAVLVAAPAMFARGVALVVARASRLRVHGACQAVLHSFWLVVLSGCAGRSCQYVSVPPVCTQGARVPQRC